MAFLTYIRQHADGEVVRLPLAKMTGDGSFDPVIDAGAMEVTWTAMSF
jgi:hypothetical protein